MIGAVKKGASAVWDKVTADHPPPKPVEKVRTPPPPETQHSCACIPVLGRIFPTLAPLQRTLLQHEMEAGAMPNVITC